MHTTTVVAFALTLGAAPIGPPCWEQQIPAVDGAIFSDVDCDGCFQTGVQVIADDFVFTEARSIDVIRFLGAYFQNRVLETDLFTVVFWDDNCAGD